MGETRLFTWQPRSSCDQESGVPAFSWAANSQWPTGRVGGREGGGLQGLRDKLVGDQGEIASREHRFGEVFHDRRCLKVKVSEHFVGSPASEESNDVCVHFGAKESIGSGSAKAAGGDVSGEESEGGWGEECDGITERGGDDRGSDGFPRCGEDSGQGRGWWSLMVP